MVFYYTKAQEISSSIRFFPCIILECSEFDIYTFRRAKVQEDTINVRLTNTFKYV